MKQLCKAVGAAYLFAGLMAGNALAQTFPSKPITMVIPFAPGGSTDTIGRIVAEKMSAKLGERILVENRPGAGAVTGSNTVAKAKPDGYTLLGYGGAAMTPAFVKNLPFDLMRDFAPVGTVYQGSLLLVGSNTSPAGAANRSLKELIAYAKANPGKLNVGASSLLSRAGGLFLLKELGIEATLILYKGTSEAALAVARGEIDVAVDSTNPATRAQMDAGRVRGVVVLGRHKNAVFPEMPTALDLQLPRLVLPASGGVWAPAGTPQSIIATLNAALNFAVQTPEVQTTVRQGGHQPSSGTTPEEYRRIIQEEANFWTQAAKVAGIQPQ